MAVDCRSISRSLAALSDSSRWRGLSGGVSGRFGMKLPTGRLMALLSMDFVNHNKKGAYTRPRPRHNTAIGVLRKDRKPVPVLTQTRAGFGAPDSAFDL